MKKREFLKKLGCLVTVPFLPKVLFGKKQETVKEKLGWNNTKTAPLTEKSLSAARREIRRFRDGRPLGYNLKTGKVVCLDHDSNTVREV